MACQLVLNAEKPDVVGKLHPIAGLRFAAAIQSQTISTRSNRSMPRRCLVAIVLWMVGIAPVVMVESWCETL